MAMLRRLFFCCFPSEQSLQEPGIDSIVSNALLSVQEQSRDFQNLAGTAGVSESVADVNAVVSQEEKTDAPDLPDPTASNVSGASSPGSASKTAPGTPPLDTQGFAETSGVLDAKKSAAAVSGTGSDLLGEAQSWAQVAAAGMESFTSEARSVLDKIGQSQSAIAGTFETTEANARDNADKALIEVEESAGAAISALENVRASAEEEISKTKRDATAAAELAASGNLPQAEGSAAAAVSALDSAGAAAVNAVDNAESQVIAAAESMEERGVSAAEEALKQVDAAGTALESEAVETKATLASVVSPTDIKAAANAAMRASSVMEHLEQRSVSSMSTVKPKVNTAVVASDGLPDTSQSADEETAEAGCSDQSTEDVPGGMDDAAGAAGAAKKPKKKNAKKKSGKKKGKSNKSK